jgi:hypothetical protein
LTRAGDKSPPPFRSPPRLALVPPGLFEESPGPRKRDRVRSPSSDSAGPVERTPRRTGWPFRGVLCVRAGDHLLQGADWLRS